MPSRAEVIERERRWALPVAIVTMVAVVLIVASEVIRADLVSDELISEQFLKVDGKRSQLLMWGFVGVLGTAMLAIPLVHLFTAASARSNVMRPQLIGLVFAGPMFLAAAELFQTLLALDLAQEFSEAWNPSFGEIPGSESIAEELAEEFRTESSWPPFAIGFGLGGAIGYSVGMAYSAYHAMKAGLLTRFWGTLGLALGIVSILLFQFTLLWFIYIGLLFAGWVPGGRPAAWEAGEAVPWPTPGEELAASLEKDKGGDLEGTGTELEGTREPSSNPPRQRGERRKRKRR